MAEWSSRLASFVHGPGLLIAAALVAATLLTVMFNGGSHD